MVWMKSLPLLLCIGVLPSSARKWQDLQTVHAPIPRDIVRSLHFESDPFSPTLPPTLSPTGQGSNTPTPPTPTVSPPSLDPTRRPTIGTASPTRVDDPTTANPTRSPTHGPTVEAFPDNDTPMNPPRGYFNYDTSESALYGPGTPMLVFENDDFVIRYQNNGWEYVLPSDDYYWDEFGANGHGPWNGILEGRNMDENMCGSGARQSPIDIRLSGVACVEHHQIRTRVSFFGRSGGRILPLFPVVFLSFLRMCYVFGGWNSHSGPSFQQKINVTANIPELVNLNCYRCQFLITPAWRFPCGW